MLTLYFAGATFLQSWRIKQICKKISDEIMQQSSIAFYTILDSADHVHGFDPEVAISSYCSSPNNTKLTVNNILWMQANRRGLSISPTQSVHINSWTTFPLEKPSVKPFYHDNAPEELNLCSEQLVHLLLETKIAVLPEDCSENFVKLENYGKLLAWRIDTHLAILLETDFEHFTKLLVATYLQSNCFVNDQLSLIRIESVSYKGLAQNYEDVALGTANFHLSITESPTAAEHLSSNIISLDVLSNKSATPTYEDDDLPNKAETETEVEANTKVLVSKLNIEPDLITETQRKISANGNAKQMPCIVESNSKPKELRANVSPEHTSAAELPTLLHSNLLNTAPPKSAENLTVLPAEQLSKNSSCASIIASSSSLKSATSGNNAAASPLKLTPSDNSPTTHISEILNSVANAKASSETTLLESQASSEQHLQPQSSINITTSKSELLNQNKQPNITSTRNLSTSVPVLKDNTDSPRNKQQLTNKLNANKPPNILVYSDSTSARTSAVSTLRNILENDRYTIYEMTAQQAEQKFWMDSTTLVVVCGNVPLNIGEILVDYFLRGGYVLSLCSDILHFVLPNYRTAEVREHELVQFSYDKWQKVKMMHHIFCYQPSPVKKNFSVDYDDSAPSCLNSKKSALVCPRSIELKDLFGELHNLDVQVLGFEETWNTPSLLLANSLESGGKAIFSQVHLESSPTQFETDEHKFTILQQNEPIRLEILANLLNKYLGMEAAPKSREDAVAFQNGYFLGHHEAKFDLLAKLQSSGNSTADNTITTSKLTMRFFTKKEEAPMSTTNSVLPILIHCCPEDFSTVDYFEILQTKYVGRLVIYAPIINSSMNVINELELTNGLAVITRQQTQGEGRSNNQWISPLGCAMFSIQLHISLNTPLGQRLPIIQHIIGAAIVQTLRGHQQYKVLDISLKWPNDIIGNGVTKLGGLIVKTLLNGSNAIVNIGCGINLDNSKPTLCINDIITKYNLANRTNLPTIKYEQFIALVFNEIERLIELVQSQQNGFESFQQLYYNLWLHSNQMIDIASEDGSLQNVKIIGIDEYGYLKVQLANGACETVQPNGNSFDMIKGLIIPKFH